MKRLLTIPALLFAFAANAEWRFDDFYVKGNLWTAYAVSPTIDGEHHGDNLLFVECDPREGLKSYVNTIPRSISQRLLSIGGYSLRVVYHGIDEELVQLKWSESLNRHVFRFQGDIQARIDKLTKAESFTLELPQSNDTVVRLTFPRLPRAVARKVLAACSTTQR